MSPADLQTLARKLKYLQKNIDLLQPYRTLTTELMESAPEKRFTAERLLQTAIESCIDCARLLILLNDWRKLRDERDALLLLVDRQIIDDDLAQRMLRAKGFRNILVHEYIAIDPALVARFLAVDIDDLQSYAIALANYLKKPL